MGQLSDSCCAWHVTDVAHLILPAPTRRARGISILSEKKLMLRGLSISPKWQSQEGWALAPGLSVPEPMLLTTTLSSASVPRGTMLKLPWLPRPLMSRSAPSLSLALREDPSCVLTVHRPSAPGRASPALAPFPGSLPFKAESSYVPSSWELSLVCWPPCGLSVVLSLRLKGLDANRLRCFWSHTRGWTWGAIPIW